MCVVDCLAREGNVEHIDRLLLWKYPYDCTTVSVSIANGKHDVLKKFLSFGLKLSWLQKLACVAARNDNVEALTLIVSFFDEIKNLEVVNTINTAYHSDAFRIVDFIFEQYAVWELQQKEVTRYLFTSNVSKEMLVKVLDKFEYPLMP